MEKKKGFTLVELLAVIAILAILVVIAMPNVMKMFEKARKETFLTEARTIYTESTKKYISENMQGNHISLISKDNNKLSLDGEEMDYCVLLDERGKVKKLAVSNGKYYLIKSNIEDINSATIEDVKEGTLEGFNCSPSGFKTTVRCEYDGNLNKEAKYVNGQYTYTYKQSASRYSFETDGWSVELTDKNSTDPVNTIPCSTINDIPIVSMGDMFAGSKATSIDVSSFDTSNIIDMVDVFYGSQATTIIGLDSFDTSKVTNMGYMFYNASATTGYARTQADADKFNSSSNKPSGLNFRVKR